MTIWWLVLIIGSIISLGSGFIYLIIHLRPAEHGKPDADLEIAANQDVEHIFNDDFREELRNRGRLHFEKILGENAMFLQQDLRLTTAQLNDYMKGQISSDLKKAFENYEGAISDARQLAVESIEKTKTAIDEQRKEMAGKLEQELAQDKLQRVKQFDKNMAEIVNHYILAALGSELDLNDQLEYILAELEANKAAMLEDIKNGV
jgi:F0F1-type ATP synthase membrane subunit b/b'